MELCPSINLIQPRGTKNLQSILQSAEFDEVHYTWKIWPWHQRNVLCIKYDK